MDARLSQVGRSDVYSYGTPPAQIARVLQGIRLSVHRAPGFICDCGGADYAATERRCVPALCADLARACPRVQCHLHRTSVRFDRSGA